MAEQNVIIYIHGITPAPAPGLHKRDYDSFAALLNDALTDLGKIPPEHRIDVEWGYRGPTIATDDKILAETERYLHQQAEEIADQNWDYTVNPLRMVYTTIRKSFMLGFSDMFYYIAEDGKEAVRQNVLSTILHKLQPLADGDSYAVTIVSHSAGTVIMHDLLYLIFGGGTKHFLKDPVDVNLLVKLKGLALNGRFRVRLFVTMGSPITPMIVRSKTLLETINNKGQLNGKIPLDTLGVTGNARWLNFWDKDDIISYPVEFLYRNDNGFLRDCAVDIGDTFPDVHSAYWEAEEVARVVAERY